MSAASEIDAESLADIVAAYEDLLGAQLRLVQQLHALGLLADSVALAAVAKADQLDAAICSLRARRPSLDLRRLRCGQTDGDRSK